MIRKFIVFCISLVVATYTWAQDRAEGDTAATIPATESAPADASAAAPEPQTETTPTPSKKNRRAAKPEANRGRKQTGKLRQPTPAPDIEEDFD